VDLMRYSSSAPSGAMEYLIIQLMLHAKSGGYNWFNLGMAPLAGLEGIHSGRQWHRVGSMIYRAGEAFYNFRGLKTFKDKFGPHWESRFLVYPPGSNLARILSSVAVLINFKGVKLSGQLAPIPGPGHKKVS
jgi:phosphatidylglycerol lysyltransferase